VLKVKGKHGEYQIEGSGKTQKLNAEAVTLDQVELSEGHFHILREGRSFRVEVEKADRSTKEFIVKVNGRSYDLKAQDEMDLLLEKLGMDKASAAVIDDLKAPMPGLVIDINVQGGQEVKKGDALVILEAMKMENVLKAPADLTVKEIQVKKGQTVDKNTVLIKF